MNDEATGRPLMTGRLQEELAHRRVLMLDTALDEDNGAWLMTKLMTLAADQPKQRIWLWINSPGGSVPVMLAIRDIIRSIRCEVATLALGMAASAGQFLLSSGTPGLRYALPHSRVLLHQGSSGIGGSAADVELAADELRGTRDTVLGLIAQDTGQPMERIFEDSLRDRWYSAEQAKDYGFVDHIVSDFDQIAPVASRYPVGLTSQVERARPGSGDSDEGGEQT